MQSLDINIHKTHLTNILLDIYKDSDLCKSLGFKGGTATMFFYSLPRFSVDLDFDLTSKFSPNSKELEIMIKKMTSLLQNKYTIKDQNVKFNTLFWAVSYAEGTRQIKVEVSTRDQPFNNYDLEPFYGMTVKLSQIRDMIAHKMTAISDRKSLANRDLFDTHFFLSSKYATDINYEIIKQKTGKTPDVFYKDLLSFLEKVDNKNLLDGLGELIDEKQKYWVKSNLLKELTGLIERQIDLKTWS